MPCPWVRDLLPPYFFSYLNGSQLFQTFLRELIIGTILLVGFRNLYLFLLPLIHILVSLSVFPLLSLLFFFQDLIEKVVILRKAVQLTQAVDTNAVGFLLAEKMSQYANLLAAQGSIAAALAFLPECTNQVIRTGHFSSFNI